MSARHEKFWGKRGNAHLCVTRAMQAELRHSWGISATVFHDRAPSSFRPCSLQEQHALWKRLEPALMEALHPQDCIAASISLEQSRAGDTASTGSSQAWHSFHVPSHVGSHEKLAISCMPGGKERCAAICLLVVYNARKFGSQKQAQIELVLV